jgi:hypothetical protein
LPELRGAALSIVYRTIAGFRIRKAGLRRRQAESGAATLIQRFGRCPHIVRDRTQDASFDMRSSQKVD